jgi:signal peptidase I
VTAVAARPAPSWPRAWLAFLFSLYQPGLGQLYAGRLTSAAFFYAALLLWIAVSWIMFWNPPPGRLLAGLAVLIAGSLVLRIAGAIEAAAGARRVREPRRPWYSRWYICLAVFVVLEAAGSAMGQAILLHARAFHIPAGSMMPNVRIGDYLVADMDPGKGEIAKPCDIVVFRKPGDSSNVIFIKRVIATSGDQVGYAQGRLRLNGRTVPRELVSTEDDGARIYRESLPSGCNYLIREASDDQVLDNVPDAQVPTGAFYVLGDNRDDSADSRISEVGFIPFDHYGGRAVIVYWAADHQRIGTLLY